MDVENTRTGDVVELKSGSINMVISAMGDNWITCIWMTKSGDIEEMKFNPVCLVKSNPKTSYLDDNLID